MNSAEFDRLFKTKDWSAVEVCRRAGPPIVPSVEPHLRDADEVVRLLAVDCIAAAGGPQAPLLLIRALGDANEQVRNNAVNALHQNLPVGQENKLLAAWDANHTRDGYIRQQIPMILGRMPAAAARLVEIKARIGADPRQEVRDGVIAGTAKLGDAFARTRFAELLLEARGKRTAELIEFVKYLDDPWVIRPLAPVLTRKDLAVDLSTHRRELRRRECDLAADEIMRIGKARFSFAANPLAQYSDAQLEEVLRYAQTH